MRKILLLIAALSPRFLKYAIYRKVFGWHIGQRTRIGLSFIDAENVFIGDDVFIGRLNIIRSLKTLHIGDGALMAQNNRIIGYPHPDERFHSRFVLGHHSHIMAYHFFDASHDIEIGHHSVVGGGGTSFWTHSLRFAPSGYEAYPISVRLGRYVYVGAVCQLVGCDIPDRTMIGAGSVVSRRFAQEDCGLLIAGNPAEIRKRYTENLPPLEPGPDGRGEPVKAPLCGGGEAG
ncbi:MAG TPA: hypothetical protein VGM37_20000 [Armatimonadota bacterium]|jgi:acetyltransferase-like isoleucine patch superfamily enzyme